MINYDDVQLVAAIARAKSVLRAQATLGGHVATIYRRLRSLERKVGGLLFERIGDALAPTSRAEPFLEAAADLAERLADVDRRVAAQDDRLVGPLQVTTADSLLPAVCDCLLEFRRSHPEVQISLEVANAFADLRLREADVAIRPTTSPPETLIGRRAATFSFRPYHAPKSLPGWIGFSAEMSSVPAARWVDEHVAQAEITLRISGMYAAAQASAAGWGKAVLPDYLGKHFGLLSAGNTIEQLDSDLWVLFHPDLRTNARVQTFASFASQWLQRRLAAE